MKITQFKNMVALYGADITRWEGADIEEVKSLIRDSAEARALYKEAEALDDALDSFDAGAPDPALLDKVMRRIDGGATAKAATPFLREDKPAPPASAAPTWGMQMQYYWIGAVACAVALLVFVGMVGDTGKPSGTSMTLAANSAMVEPAEPRLAARDIDQFLAELGTMVEEDVAEQEIIGLLAMADTTQPATDQQNTAANPAPAADEDIDAFLDRLFSDMEDDPALQQEMDMWHLFLEGDNQEL